MEGLSINNKEEIMLRYNDQLGYYMTTDGLEPCYPVPCATTCVGIPKTKKEEIPMNYNQTAIVATAAAESETPKQRRYLMNRVYDVYSTKRAELEKKFNINDIYPQSPEELAQLIKDGHFYIKGLDTPKAERRYFDMYSALRFRKAPADQEGFEKAKDELKAARQVAEDAIAILPIEDAFTAFKTFEQFPTA